MSEPTTILIAEDHADLRIAYEVYLTSHGFNVDMAENGQAVLTYLRSKKPDVVVMDMELPVLDGWEAVRAIRSRSVFADLSIIAVTGHVYPKHRHRAADLGCDGFLGKPFDLDQLALEIKHVLAAKWSERALLRVRSSANRPEQARLREQLAQAMTRVEAGAARLQQNRLELAHALGDLKRIANTMIAAHP